MVSPPVRAPSFALGLLCLTACGGAERGAVGTPPPAPNADRPSARGDLPGTVAEPAPAAPGEPSAPRCAGLTIAAVGDVLLHRSLQRQAFADPRWFMSLWSDVAPQMGEADVTYANFEGPAARGVNTAGEAVPDAGAVVDDEIYGGFPRFNFHPRALEDLAELGVDVVSTANNHSLDRHALGARRTLEAAAAAGLTTTGTRRATSDSFHATTTHHGVRLAWLACTKHVNGVPDPHGLARRCYAPEGAFVQEVRDAAADPSNHVVVALPHFGDEYVHEPNTAQRELVAQLFEAGADLIIGNHPHVVQPWQWHERADGTRALAAYSLGNFVSEQRTLARRSSLILRAELEVRSDGRVDVRNADYTPIHVRKRRGRFSVELARPTGSGRAAHALVANILGDPPNPRALCTSP